MKWAIAILCVLGVVAALSAAMLVSALRLSADNARNMANLNGTAGATTNPSTQPTTVSVLCASEVLQPMTVVDGSMVRVKTIPASQAPATCMINPTDVVGKVLATKMFEGDMFTSSNFSTDSAYKQLASVIPPGKRAVGISVTDFQSLAGMLFPGSTVDVIASFKVKNYEDPTKPDLEASTTLLENLQVLAIDDQTVVNVNNKTILDGGVEANRTNSNSHVTLLVDSHQAKLLELAMDKGTLSLALRNPLDDAAVDGSDVWEETLLQDYNRHFHVHAPEAAPMPMVKADVPAVAPHWDTVVIRGAAVETESFPMPQASH